MLSTYAPACALFILVLGPEPTTSAKYSLYNPPLKLLGPFTAYLLVGAAGALYDGVLALLTVLTAGVLLTVLVGAEVDPLLVGLAAGAAVVVRLLPPYDATGILAVGENDGILNDLLTAGAGVATLTAGAAGVGVDVGAV